MLTVIPWPANLSTPGDCQRVNYKKFNRFPLAANLSSHRDCLESGKYTEKSSIFPIINHSVYPKDSLRVNHTTANISQKKYIRFLGSIADTLTDYSLKALSIMDIHAHFSWI